MRRKLNLSQNRRRSGRLKRPDDRESLRRWSFVAVLIISSGVLIYLIFFSGYLSITSVQLENSDTISDEQVRASIEPILSGKRWYVFPAENILLLPETRLAEKIINDIPQISTVEIKKKFPDTISVTITERDPVLIWWTDSAAYKMDLNGVITDITSPDDDSLPVLKSRVEERYKEHDTVVDSQMIDFFLRLFEQFSARTSIAVQYYYTPSPISEQVHVVTEEGWEVYFDSSRDVDTQLSVLLTVLNDKVGEDRSKVEYIDISSEGWVYMK